MENTVRNEDCLTTQTLMFLEDVYYDYMITSPPDFEEVEMNPKYPDDWVQFLADRLTYGKPRNGLTTVFTTDRRFKGTTIAKDQLVMSCFSTLLSHKIWVKSYKANLYRPNFTHLLTFGNAGHRSTPVLPDVFFDEFHPIGKYTYNFSLDIVKTFIQAYTNEGDTVYDPFMGSGTTALACIQLNRKFIGSEIVPETYQLCLDRIANEQATTRKMVNETQRPSGSNQSQKETEEETLQPFFIG